MQAHLEVLFDPHELSLEVIDGLGIPGGVEPFQKQWPLEKAVRADLER